MRRFHQRLVYFGLTLFGGAGCLLGPNNEQVLTSPASLVIFNGYLISPSTPIYVFAGPSPTGPWTEIASDQSATSPLDLPNGAEVYGFTARASVPAHIWTNATCNEDEAYIYVSAGSPSMSSALYTFDHESVSGVNPIACLADNNYNPAPCASASSPVVRVRAPSSNGPTSHIGNITIDDQPDLDQWGCLETLDGNLTITETIQADITIPALHTITGDLAITYPRYSPGPSFIDETYRRSMPSLTNIGGSFLATTPDVPGDYVNLDVELGGVTSIGGDVTVSSIAFNTDFDGLTALAAVTGNVRINAGSGDYTGTLLSGVSSVTGNVHVSLGHNVFGAVMPSLSTIGGDFLLDDGNPNAGTFGSLVTVNGDFTVSGAAMNAPTPFGALSQVSGRVTLANVQGFPNFKLGAGPVQSSGLTLDSIASLGSIGVGEIDVQGNGSIEITNNSGLCTSTAEAYVNTLPLFTGTSNISGNAGC